MVVKTSPVDFKNKLFHAVPKIVNIDEKTSTSINDFTNNALLYLIFVGRVPRVFGT